MLSKLHLAIALTIIIAGCNDPATEALMKPCHDEIPGEV
jgi:hypothetical protein